MPTWKLAKWKILLSEFDIIYVTQKAVKGQALADHLVENLVGGEYKPLKTYFPDKEVSFVGEYIAEAYNGWRMFFDGAANFWGVGIGAILVLETGQHYPVSAKLRFPCTNNMAEYEAYILWPNLAVDMNIQELLVIVTKKVVVDFVRDHIVCRFGVPESIITDNAANLNSDLMKAICETFKIKHENSITYKPRMNGAVEATNKNIKKILRKMVENHKKWHEKLPFSILGYRTIVCTSTRATPYLLVYDTEAVIPAKVEIPSLWIIQEAELSDAEWIRSRYEKLALADRKRMNLVSWSALLEYNVQSFQQKGQTKTVHTGAAGVEAVFPHQDEAKGKFSPKWQGPYMVHRVLI
ncbi:uncharacterized protein [Nicotiana sylvestris]|uniref:uncharacterized protein n=1 Tax=Nicotiana sylvestris TaxID=4096 RepID=UPI00388C9A92